MISFQEILKKSAEAHHFTSLPKEKFSYRNCRLCRTIYGITLSRRSFRHVIYIHRSLVLGSLQHEVFSEKISWQYDHFAHMLLKARYLVILQNSTASIYL